MNKKFTIDIDNKIIEFDEGIKPRINSVSNVSDQSKYTYSNLDLKGLKKTILKYLIENKAATRKMISKATGINTATMPSPMNKLINLGLVASSSQLHPCASTGNMAIWQSINPAKIDQVKKLIQ